MWALQLDFALPSIRLRENAVFPALNLPLTSYTFFANRFHVSAQISIFKVKGEKKNFFFELDSLRILSRHTLASTLYFSDSDYVMRFALIHIAGISSCFSLWLVGRKVVLREDLCHPCCPSQLIPKATGSCRHPISLASSLSNPLSHLMLFVALEFPRCSRGTSCQN